MFLRGYRLLFRGFLSSKTSVWSYLISEEIQFTRFFCETIFPLWSKSIVVPTSAETCRVEIETVARAQSELKASPRNPKVETEKRSENVDSFDVACFVAEIKGQIQFPSSSNHQIVRDILYSFKIILRVFHRVESRVKTPNLEFLNSNL